MAFNNDMDHFQTFTLHMSEIWRSMCFECWFKVPVCLIMGGFAFLFGMANGSFLLALVALIGFDFIMGISATYVMKEEIQSRRALKTASKLAVYGILCSAAYLVETIVPGTTLIDTVMISFLAITELISIMEKAGKMGFVVPQRLLNQLRIAQDKK